jgi:hypothetical protein
LARNPRPVEAEQAATHGMTVEGTRLSVNREHLSSGVFLTTHFGLDTSILGQRGFAVKGGAEGAVLGHARGTREDGVLRARNIPDHAGAGGAWPGTTGRSVLE